jgi:hypothetical protein
MARPGLIPLLVVGGLAIGLTAVVALQLLVLQPVLPAVALGVGAIAMITIAVAIALRRPRVVTSAEVALLLVYILVLIGRSASSLASASAPILAGGIFLSAQLGWWAIELRTPAHEATPALWNRASQIGASSLGAAFVAELIWQASRIHPGSGIVFVALGVLATIGVVALYVRITAPRTWVPSTGAPKSSAEAGSEPNRYRKHPRSTRQRLLGAVGSLVRPADIHKPWRSRSRHSVRLQAFLAIVLLVIDTGFTLAVLGTSVHPKIIDGVRSFVSTGNAAPGIALGLIGAAAIIAGWLALSLRSVVSPLAADTSRLADDSPQVSTLTDLETIRTMCRRAWRSERPDPDLERFLASVGNRLGDKSSESVAADSSGPTSLARLESTLRNLEHIADV